MTRNSDRLHLALLLVFYELCFSLALIPSATTRRFANRQTFLFGCLLRTAIYVIRETTTDSQMGDIVVGTVLAVQVLMALDGIYFTDPDTLKNLYAPTSEKKITEAPLLDRIRWTFDLYTNPRGIGWAHEPRHLPPPPPTTSSLGRFLFVRFLQILLAVVAGSFALVINASNPGLTTPNSKLSESEWIYRMMAVVGLGIGATAVINTVHALVSVVVVGLGFSKPERWLDLFGSPFDAWNLRNVWRKVWHQMLRKPFLSATHFILVTILRLPPLSRQIDNKIMQVMNKLLWIYIPFLISGLVHMAGEYMLLGKMAYGSLIFFFLQALGITLEKMIAVLWCRFGLGHQEKEERGKTSVPFWLRCLGLGYVVLWISWSLPFYGDTMVNTDIFVHPEVDLRRRGWVLPIAGALGSGRMLSFTEL